MADILIKGMEMPKRCTGCFNSKCLLFFEHTDPDNSRHPNCPIIELPQHGRLIDADKLREALLSDEDDRFFTIEDIDEVDNAPTVLEASNVF